LVLIAVVNTIISLYYYLLVIRAMFIEKNDNPIPALKTDNYNRLSLILCSTGIMLVGILSFIMEKIGTYSFGM